MRSPSYQETLLRLKRAPGKLSAVVFMALAAGDVDEPPALAMITIDDDGHNNCGSENCQRLLAHD